MAVAKVVHLPLEHGDARDFQPAGAFVDVAVLAVIDVVYVHLKRNGTPVLCTYTGKKGCEEPKARVYVHLERYRRSVLCTYTHRRRVNRGFAFVKEG